MFMNDNRHGQGTLCSEQDTGPNVYIYDGEWFEGHRNGMGQEITSKGKYTGEWLEDQRHGKGISVDENDNMYDGLFMFGKKHGAGKLTKCHTSSTESEHQIDIIEGVWENDELVQETSQQAIGTN